MLKKLQRLNIARCLNVKTLPASIGSLSSLEELSAYECISLGVIPPSLQFCSSLRSLAIHLDPCADLETFFTGCVGKAWPKLISLSLHHDHGLISRLDFSAFRCLRYLGLSDKTLSELPESIGLLMTLDRLK